MKFLTELDRNLDVLVCNVGSGSSVSSVKKCDQIGIAHSR